LAVSWVASCGLRAISKTDQITHGTMDEFALELIVSSVFKATNKVELTHA
jgi:hypothetical protein